MYYTLNNNDNSIKIMSQKSHNISLVTCCAINLSITSPYT